MIEYYFIHNPIAGGHNVEKVAKTLQKVLRNSKIPFLYRFWEYPEQLPELIQEAKTSQCKAIIGIGGDGTLHQIGKHLLHSPIALGIIPIGSGNGIANHFRIPKSPSKALQHLLSHHEVKEIDIGLINDQIPFFGFAGFGFDAEIAHLFSRANQRGFLTYLVLILKHLKRAQSYSIPTSNFSLQSIQGYVITICNVNQFGNEAIIAPFARADDGKLDLCIVKRFSFPDLISLAFNLFIGTLYRHPAYITFRIERVTFLDHPTRRIHIDGEPYVLNPPYHITIIKKGLKLLLPASL